MAKVRFSGAFQAGHGKLGGMVVAGSRTGPIIRRRPRYERPVSIDQRSAIDRMREASSVWSTLSAAEAAAWRDYAAGQQHADPVSGLSYAPTAITVFIGLAAKVRQIDPAAGIPRLPPVGEFLGDAIQISAAGHPGEIVFTASGPNSAEVVTELLVQRLANERRKPTKRYGSAGFVRFEGGSLSAILEAEPGWYACAWRQVERTTGRMLRLMPIGVVEVG
ncbi:MAG: hypothetical protein HONBIEJF_02585 [Fimbriimonadaceae bacterium]|nr:hypothetical protein [Fimbriimonadaceae bacterium]